MQYLLQPARHAYRRGRTACCWLKQRRRVLWRAGALGMAGLLIGIALSNLWITFQSAGRLYNDVRAVPERPVALLLGTSSRISNGNVNLYFEYRMDAAAQLYKAGKVKHIIASGDNRTRYYDEPTSMKRALLARGVPESAITLDYAGFRTLDSVVRCKEIFSQTDIVVVSQAFHNRRALFISDFYGIEAIGFNAQDVSASVDLKTRLREYLARFKAVLDLYVFNTRPKFLGEKVPLPTQGRIFCTASCKFA